MNPLSSAPILKTSTFFETKDHDLSDGVPCIAKEPFGEVILSIKKSKLFGFSKTL